MPSETNLSQKNTKLVSVIIPAYNAGQFLGETVDSVLASDYYNIEIIIMDDGSNDKTLDIARGYEARDARIHVFTQKNAGVCHARNNAILKSHGEYILPVDADDIVLPGFIGAAVRVLDNSDNVKVVVPRAEFFGDKTGEWILPSFDIHRLARKNTIPCCAMYRRGDWDKTEGYCAEIKAREDWEFWISMLKDGGDVYRLPEICFRYRIRKASKRSADRKLKRHVVSTLNKRHPEFFERELHGPLRLHRTWSVLINRICRFLNPRTLFLNPLYADIEYVVKSLPVLFSTGKGKIIHDGRNKLREFRWGDKTYVVKSYKVPNIINRIVYGIFRSSKAQRSYEYAEMLRSMNIGSPEPVAWITERRGILFTSSFYVSVKSECPYTYADIMKGNLTDPEKYLRAVARTTALMHNNGLIHKDYSRGNILFGDTPEGVKVELVDLNRIRIRKNITLEEGCRNFSERLWATDEMRRVMAEEYAEVRGLDPAECYKCMKEGNNPEYSKIK